MEHDVPDLRGLDAPSSADDLCCLSPGTGQSMCSEACGTVTGAWARLSGAWRRYDAVAANRRSQLRPTDGMNSINIHEAAASIREPAF